MYQAFRVAAFAALLSTPAAAITFSFTAEFSSATPDETSIVDSIVDRARPFSTLTGTISVDPTPLGPSIGGGTLYGAPTLAVDQFVVPTLSSTVPPRVQVVNDLFTPFSTNVTDVFATSVGPGTPPTTPLLTQAFNFFFEDTSGTAFDSTALPTELDLADFTSAGLSFVATQWNGMEFGERENIVYSFTDVSVIPPMQPIPLPASLPLFAAALGFGFLTRSRKTCRTT